MKTNNTNIVEALSLFNNRTFTKRQWEVILKGCGCPKSAHFWSALLKHMVKYQRGYIVTYTLTDMCSEAYENVYKTYREINNNYVTKHNQKKKAKAKAQRVVTPMSFVVNPDGTVSLFSERDNWDNK